MEEFLFKIMSLILTIVKWLLILLLLLTLFGIIIPFISDINSFPYLRPGIHFEATINAFVKEFLPTRIAHYDVSRFITLVLIIIVINICGFFIEKLNAASEKRSMVKRLKKMHAVYQTPEQRSKITLLEAKLEQAGAFSGKTRRELLKNFADIKKELEKIGRDLTFLSIDVVGSTEMKKGEDSATIELDFLEYHNYVEAIFHKHGLIKASWTPDGVMACFNTIDEALQAAQEILNGLEYFNREVKSMKQDFVLRCGINSGHVFYDDSIPLEQFSDRVIDIAGHMQKHAPPNSILIAKQVIEPASNVENFQSTQRIVDGLEVCEWIKNEKKPNE